MQEYLLGFSVNYLFPCFQWVLSPGETRSDFTNSSRLLHWQGAWKDEEDRLKTLQTKTKRMCVFCTGNENVIFLFAWAIVSSESLVSSFNCFRVYLC